MLHPSVDAYEGHRQMTMSLRVEPLRESLKLGSVAAQDGKWREVSPDIEIDSGFLLGLAANAPQHWFVRK